MESMDGFVTVRIPAGAVVQMPASELARMEAAAPGAVDEAAPAAPENAAVEVLSAAPARPLPLPSELSDGEKGALRDWFRRRGDTPKYITKQRIAEYVAATGDAAFEHVFEDEAAPEDEAALGLDRLIVRGLGTGVLDPQVLARLVAGYSTNGSLSGVQKADEPKLYQDVQDAIGEV